jgi:hypothetical protein
MCTALYMHHEVPKIPAFLGETKTRWPQARGHRSSGIHQSGHMSLTHGSRGESTHQSNSKESSCHVSDFCSTSNLMMPLGVVACLGDMGVSQMWPRVHLVSILDDTRIMWKFWLLEHFANLYSPIYHYWVCQIYQGNTKENITTRWS